MAVGGQGCVWRLAGAGTACAPRLTAAPTHLLHAAQDAEQEASARELDYVHAVKLMWAENRTREHRERAYSSAMEVREPRGPDCARRGRAGRPQCASRQALVLTWVPRAGMVCGAPLGHWAQSVYRKHPNDPDACAFYALSLLSMVASSEGYLSHDEAEQVGAWGQHGTWTARTSFFASPPSRL